MKRVFPAMLLVLLFQPAVAQNLVTNGTFDSDISGWEPDSSNDNEVTWVGDDGSTAPGSLQVSDNFNNGGVSTTAHAPVPIQAGETYSITAAAKVIGASEARAATLVIRWLDENQWATGFSNYAGTSPDDPTDQWHDIEGQFTAPEDTHFAQVMLGVETSDSGSQNDSIARWDDVRFSLADNEGFSVLAAHTGMWYLPGQSGHGVSVEILDGNRALIIWYTYDKDGNQMWVLGTGEHDGLVISVDALVTAGAKFPPDFEEEDVEATLWGQLILSFSGCDEGLFKWVPVEGNGFAAGEIPVFRLTGIQGLSCVE